MFSPSGCCQSSRRPSTVPCNASACGINLSASTSHSVAGNCPHASSIIPWNLHLSTHEYNTGSLDDTRIPYWFITGSDGYTSILEGFQRFARNNPDFSIASIIPSTLMDRVEMTDQDVATEQETLTLMVDRLND